MTVVVGYLWAAPPKEATVLEDGSVAWPGVRRTVGESERVAIEFAKELAETTDQRLVGVTIGDALTATPQAASSGLACGLDEAVIVRVSSSLGTAEAATAMAAAVSELHEVRLIVLGNAASDSGTRMFGPYLGGLLGWPVMGDVMDAGFDGNALWVVNESHGALVRYRIEGPAILSVSVASRTPRQMGLRDIMAAATKPACTVTPEELGAIQIKPVTVIATAELPTGVRQGRVIKGADADLAAAELVAELMIRGAL
jgi:electron transfer flavoprotein beta subunit